jgi:lipopolysaccharide/colanic/teichoic acid biosynthesis glycosyltransferase
MYVFVKRSLDVVGSIVGMVVLGPLLILSAVAVRLTMGKPVLFRQRRPGLSEIPFTCLKFRTMADRRDAKGALLPDELRLTRCGRFLRRTSLDELPQLFNVLCGDLSFVGPRPLLETYRNFYTPEERRRHIVRPGITGWAQIHGRKTLSFEQRFAYDLHYVDNISFCLDMYIILRTLWLLVSQRSSAVIPETPEIALDILRSQSQYSSQSQQ